MTDSGIASPSNPRIRAAAGLRDRRERERTGLTLVDGSREIGRAIDAGASIEAAFVCRALIDGPEADATLEALGRAGVPLTDTTEAAFARVAFGERAEGIVAVIRPGSASLSDLQLPDDPLVVVAEGVEKPGNLGAIIRSADGAGADALIAADPRTDLFNPNAIRASLGTIFTVPLAAADSTAVRAFLRERGIRVVAARLDASAAPWEADLRGPLAIALGSEAGGLTSAWDAADVEAVRLPMLGLADSLNVSATAAVLLYEARRQRGRPGTGRGTPPAATRAASPAASPTGHRS